MVNKIITIFIYKRLLPFIIPILILPGVLLASNLTEIVAYSNECGIMKIDTVKNLKTVEVPEQVDYLILNRSGTFTEIMPVADKNYVFPSLIPKPDIIIRHSKNEQGIQKLFWIEPEISSACKIQVNKFVSKIDNGMVSIDTLMHGYDKGLPDEVLCFIACQGYHPEVISVPLRGGPYPVIMKKTPSYSVTIVVKDGLTDKPITPEGGAELYLKTECSNNYSGKHTEENWTLNLRGMEDTDFLVLLEAPGYVPAIIKIVIGKKVPEITAEDIPMRPDWPGYFMEETKMGLWQKSLDTLYLELLPLAEVLRGIKRVVLEAPRDLFVEARLGMVGYSGVSNMSAPDTPLLPRDASIGLTHQSYGRRVNLANFTLNYMLPVGVSASYEIPVALGEVDTLLGHGWFISPLCLDMVSDMEPVKNSRIAAVRTRMKFTHRGETLFMKHPYLSAGYLWGRFHTGELEQFEEGVSYFDFGAWGAYAGCEIPIFKGLSMAPELSFLINVEGDKFYNDPKIPNESIKNSGDVSLVALELNFIIRLMDFRQESAEREE
ncbi:hypothetical protein JXI42_08640 [bacterium]|nr:hypothetical protein [bacterium]